MKLKLSSSLSLCALLLLSACTGDKNTSTLKSIEQSVPNGVAVFDLDPTHNTIDNPTIPVPSDILAGALKNGSINVSGMEYSNPVKGIATLDGFSTTSPLTTKFSEAIDANSISPAICAQNCPVKVYELRPTGVAAPPLNPVPLQFGADYFVTIAPFDTEKKTLVIQPLKPLNAKSFYAVVITKGINDLANQKTFVADDTYAILKNTQPFLAEDGETILLPALQSRDINTVKQLETLRKGVSAIELLISATQGIKRDDVILSWTFHTQSVTDVLRAKRDEIYTAETPPVSRLQPHPHPSDGPKPIYDIYEGYLSIKSYLNTAGAGPLTGHLDANGNYVDFEKNESSIINIPLLVLVPNLPNTGSEPWKTVVYQHGIFHNRKDAFSIANNLAQNGYAIVAIDLPLHGLPAEDPYQVTIGEDTVTERNFFVLPPAPAPQAAQSGLYYINLNNLLLTRDNVRQSVTDLFQLTRALDTMDYDGDGNVDAPDFDTNNVFFLGNSLGGIVGTTFLSLDAELDAEAKISASVIGMAGGGIANLVEGSQAIGPAIKAAIEDRTGIVAGTGNYASYWGGAQTILDSVDPINYISLLQPNPQRETKPLLMLKITDDTVVPNNVIGAPLSGTDPLAKLLQLPNLDLSDINDNTLKDRGLLTFGGHHNSILTSEDVDAEGTLIPGSVEATGANAAIHKAIVEFFEMELSLPTPALR